MNEADMNWLVRQLIGTAELLGQQMTPTAAAMLAGDLSAYPRDVSARALSRVRTEHAGRLTPKAIIDRIDELAGRPAANEAWAVAATALDERATVVWTEEMSDAWLIARPVAESGDMIGARMAFIAAYERLVRAARDERRMPKTWVSLGWDGEGRRVAVEKAVALGYVTPDAAQQMLPAPEAVPTFNPVALLTGRVEPAVGASPEIRRRLSVMRAELVARKQRGDEARAQAARREAQDLADRKAQAQRMVDERMATSSKPAEDAK